MIDDDEFFIEAVTTATRLVAGLPDNTIAPLPDIVGRTAQFLTIRQGDILKHEMRQALAVAYYTGLLYARLTAEAGTNANGVVVRFPPLSDVLPFHEALRLFSFETLLPEEVSTREARALAIRFRALADIIGNRT
jgi:hypothetical protein